MRITALDFGRFRLDGGAMFGVVPKVLWQRSHPADENNRIEMALRCLLVESDDRRILIDTGFGAGRTAKFQDVYAYRGGDDYLGRGLDAIGLAVEDITDVVLTHLHFDHCGGSTVVRNGERHPALPKATHYIQKRQLDHARSRLERDKASYLAEDYEPLIERGVVQLVDGPWELMPGFDLEICNGHTPALQLPRLRSASETILYGADLIPLHSQFALPWIMAYDLYPVTTLEEKRRLIPQAAQEEWLILFEHDPFHTAGRVRETERGFAFAPE